MDGRKNAISEREQKTDPKDTNKTFDVKRKRSRSKEKEKDVASVPAAAVLQKSRTDGHHSSPEAAVVGVHNDASSASDIRSRPGGRAVEVRGTNPQGGSSQLHTGKPDSKTTENGQPDAITENKDRKPVSSHCTADIQERPTSRPGHITLARDSTTVPLGRSSTADVQKSPLAAPKPSPRDGSVNTEPPKPAPRSLTTRQDTSETTDSSANVESQDAQNAPKPAPRSSAPLQTSSSSRTDNPARLESRSNHQFIADENVSVWSSAPQIERPLSTENICRICHESDQVEPLISPCLCRGTLSLVHRTCLQHWLAESDSSSCELCRFIYITKRVPKYSVLGSVVAWIRQNRRQRKALLVDTLGMIAFVPFATMITYVAAALADGIEYQESPSWTDVTVRFAIVTFISMMTTIDVAYATYWMLRAQHHFSSWYSWYRRNSDVTLLPHQQ